MYSQFGFRIARTALIAGILLISAVRPTRAQQRDTTRRKMPKPMQMPSDTATKMPRMGDRSATKKNDTSAMMMTGPLGISMDRMGSGTTWIPDAVSLPSRHWMRKDWELMLHGFVFGEYDKQSGPRGDDQFGSLNWGMFMASHELAGGQFQARTMLSLDPGTVGPRGYPLLLQTGESYRGAALHDRQHPHDFFMELGVLYDRALSEALAVELYAAPSGEPALGPVAFMHRPSAMDNPLAPIGHHWQDATHISFGVLTAGVYSRQWKLEGSLFNGREPNDQRWDFDPIKLDSYSGRLTFNPDKHWSLTAGYGYLESPEALHPDESEHRVVASALQGTAIGADGQWSSAFIWGANRFSGSSTWSNAMLVETEAILDKWNTVFGRAEYAQKSAEDLVLPSTFPATQLFSVSNASLGYIRELRRAYSATLGIGVQGIVNFVPESIRSFYGSRTPAAGLIFVRLRPYHVRSSLPAMKSMPGM